MPFFGSTVDNLLVLVISLLFCGEIYKFFFHPLNVYPGPAIAHLTNLWRFLNYFTGTQHTTDAALHDKYGPIVRIGPDSLLFGDVRAYQAIYGFSNPKIEKGEFYNLAGDPQNHVIFQARGDQEHRWLRGRLLPAAFTQKHFSEYEKLLSSFVTLFVKKLGQEQEEKGVDAIDISRVVKRLTTDTTAELVWGDSQGFLDAGFDKYGLIGEKYNITKVTFGLPLLPWLNRFLSIRTIWTKMTQTPHFDKDKNPTGLTALVVHLEKCLAKVTIAANNDQGNDNSSPSSILKNLANVREDDKRKIRDPQTLYRECLNFTFAGQGSTAAALTSALYGLGLHPYFQSLIWTELAALTPSAPYTDLWNLPHLQAFLRESLRLSPPFLGVFERVVGAGAESCIPGVQGPLPVGTRVGCNPYVMLRSKEVFGDDAELFRAERWMEGGEERKKAMEDAWVVFGRGSRACIAKEIALMLVVRLVAEVLARFEMRSDPAGVKWENHFEMHYEKAMVCFTPLAKEAGKQAGKQAA